MQTINCSFWKTVGIRLHLCPILYDRMGNPVTYRNGWKMTWERGWLLKSVSLTPYRITYDYNADGKRVKTQVYQSEQLKKESEYFWNGDQIVAIADNGKLLQFTYDQDGNPFSISQGSNTYYYLYNLQGDVIGLIDSEGTQVVSYQYDTWGVPVSTTDTTSMKIGTLNPFRYRGYCYDEATGFYYLGSRYYDPVIGRFVNADDVDGLGAEQVQW